MAKKQKSRPNTASARADAPNKTPVVAAAAAAPVVAASAAAAPAAEAEVAPESAAPADTEASAPPAAGEVLVNVTLVLPSQQRIEQLMSSQELVQTLHLQIADQPRFIHHPSFYLAHQGQRLSVLAPISELLSESAVAEAMSGAAPSVPLEIELVDAPLGERDVRQHVQRVRDVLASAHPHGSATALALDQGVTVFKALTGDRYMDPEFDRNVAPKAGGAPIESPFDTNGNEEDEKEMGEVLAQLVAKARGKPTRALGALGISAWNPAPAWRRIRGDLMYLTATLLPANNVVHITATRHGFYANASSDAVFDATKKSPVFRSLPKLLGSLSPVFAKAFAKLLDAAQLVQTSTLAMFEKSPIQLAVPATNWQVSMLDAELPHHAADHAADALRQLGGYAGIGETVVDASALDAMRAWNDEMQAIIAVPVPGDDAEPDAGSIPLNRVRQYNAAYAQFVQAAVAGARGILDGAIAPLPVSAVVPEEAIAGGAEPMSNDSIFIWNNIFFSLAEAHVARAERDGHADPVAAARVYAGKDVAGIRAVMAAGIEGITTAPTVVVDLHGRRIVAQAMPQGIIDPSSHQFVYGAIDDPEASPAANEPREVKADPEFHELMAKLAASLHLKEHTVKDEKSQEPRSLWLSADTKGLVAQDGRKYLMELARIAPVDTAFLAAAAADGLPTYPHQTPFVRLEFLRRHQERVREQYVSDAVEAERTKHREAHSAAKAAAAPTTDAEAEAEEDDSIPNFELDLTPIYKAAPTFAVNPDAGTPWDHDGAFAADQEQRDILTELHDGVIPGWVRSFAFSAAALPLTGDNLTTSMHDEGISMRLMGGIAVAIEALKAKKTESTAINGDEEQPQHVRPHIVRLNALRKVVEREMIARAFKRIVRRYMAAAAIEDLAAGVAAYLTALLAIEPETVSVSTAPVVLPSLPSKVTPALLAAAIVYEAQVAFRHTLDGASFTQPKPAVFREAAIKCGIQLVARAYGPTYAIAESDIVNLAPKLKLATLESEFVLEHKTIAERILATNGPGAAAQAFEMAHQVTEMAFSFAHPQALAIQASMAEVYLALARQPGPMPAAPENGSAEEDEARANGGDEQQTPLPNPDAPAYLARAVELQRQVVVLSERLYGVDAGEVYNAYVTLALMEMESGRPRLALKYLKHAGGLYRAATGDAHATPDWVSVSNLAVQVHKHLGRADLALRDSRSQLAYKERMFGPHSLAVGFAQREIALMQFQVGSEAMRAVQEAVFASGAVMPSAETLTGPHADALVQLREAATLAATARDVLTPYFKPEDPRIIDTGKIATLFAEQVAAIEAEQESILLAEQRGLFKKMRDANERKEIGVKGDHDVDDILAYVTGKKKSLGGGAGNRKKKSAAAANKKKATSSKKATA
ncbi:clustered mitochondria-domain-containing protein [Blastocladiella britannica]|nr:clustered mitochondria-domain-containing protein [Blastocladiella britannica]